MPSPIRSLPLKVSREHPTDADKAAIQGKFKSFHNVSDHVASLMTKTFYSLLKLSDLKTAPAKKTIKIAETGYDEGKTKAPPEREKDDEKARRTHPPGLHYNIQIHLPASKDVEVYNAIFKSLREHLLEE